MTEKRSIRPLRGSGSPSWRYVLVVAALMAVSLLAVACRGLSAHAPSPSAATEEVTATPTAAEPGGGGGAGGGVPMFRGDPAHTGVNPGPAVESSPRLLWRFQTGDDVWSSPAVVDGVVYVGSTDNYVYALDAETGE